MLLPRVGVFTLKVLPLLVAVSVTAYADTAISITEIAIATTPKTVRLRIVPPAPDVLCTLRSRIEPSKSTPRHDLPRRYRSR